MAFQIGEQVYVPRSVLGLDENAISPFHRTTVRARNERSVQVDLPDGSRSRLIATSKVSASFGVLIIRIGDFNEDGLIDPLAKSILHYCRMLLPGDAVRLVELRTEQELVRLWNDAHAVCKQVVIVGHGPPNGYLFGENSISPSRLADILCGPAAAPKEFVSLGCQTGLASFGKSFSKAACVSHFLAPFHSVHGCAASLFTKTYLHERLLAASSPKVAFKRARERLEGAASFRLWQGGNLTAGKA